jgi:hypothetical protein
MDTSEISHKKNKLEFLILFTPALKGDFQNMILLFIKLYIYSMFYFFFHCRNQRLRHQTDWGAYG